MKAFIKNHQGHGVFFLFTLLFIFFLPNIEPLSLSSSYDEKRVLQIITLGAISFFTLFSFKFRSYISTFFKNISVINFTLVILFFLIGVISSFLAIFPAYSLMETGNYYLLLLLSLFIASSVQRIDSASVLIIYAFIASALLFSIAFFSALIAGISVGTVDYSDLFIHFSNRRFFNQFQSISFPILLIAPLFLNINKKTYYALGLLAAFWLMLMLVSNGRATVIASILGVIISGFFSPQYRKKWWAHAFLITLLGTLFFLSFNWLLSSFKVIDGDILRASSSGRFQIWLKTLEIAKEAPLLGIGPMHLSLTPMSFSVAHPHNITIQTMAEWGVPATIILIYLISLGFFKWILLNKKIHNPKNLLLTTALSSSFIASVIHGQLSGVFVMPLSQLSFAIICGWMIGLYFSTITPNNDKPAHQMFSNTLVISTSLIALSAILYGSSQYRVYPTPPPSKQNTYIEGKYPAAKSPRFWGETLIPDM